MQLTWKSKLVSNTDPWNFGCEESQTLDLHKVWNDDIAQRLVDSLTPDEQKLDLTVTFEAVARILRFSHGSVLNDLEEYGLLGVILQEYTHNDPKIAEYILEIFGYYALFMEGAVEEMIEYDMVWVIYDIMDQPSHYQQWKLLTNGLVALRHIADTEMTSFIDQKWKMKHELERPLYNILLPALKKIAEHDNHMECVMKMLIEFSACLKSMIIHDQPANDDHNQCIKNLGNIMLTCGIIPNQQIWCNISHTLPAIISSNTVIDVRTSIKSKILKPMYRNWDLSLKVQVINGLNEWIIQEQQPNDRIVTEMTDELVNCISPVEELVAAMISLFKSIIAFVPAQLKIEWVLKIAIECETISQMDQLYLIMTTIIARNYL